MQWPSKDLTFFHFVTLQPQCILLGFYEIRQPKVVISCAGEIK